MHAPSHPAPIPIVVDMDGTLLRGDSLHESALHLVRARPLALLALPLWLARGRAALKRRIGEEAAPASELWPLRADLIAWLEERAAEGHAILLATAADRRIAEAVAARVPVIGETLASDGVLNLKGAAKADALARRFPEGFLYVGNHRSDAAVWRVPGTGAVLAGPVARLRRHTGPARVAAEFPDPPGAMRTWRRALRLHQWAKNLLVLAPLLPSGHALDAAAWGRALVAFVALGLVASATYLLNDLWDLDSDRRHPTKRRRPIASGDLAIARAIPAMLLLGAGGLALGGLLGAPPLAVLACYAALTLAYSFGLKRIAILDVTVLGLLFTVRLLLGAAAIQVPASRWLLIFAMFLFASLSIAKRCAELRDLAAAGGGAAAGRGYQAADFAVMLPLGVATATGAVFVFVMYLVEEAFPDGVYRWPGLLWAVPMILFVWLGRLWLLCARGVLHEDPVLFALRDRASLALGAAMAVAFAAAMAIPAPG